MPDPKKTVLIRAGSAPQAKAAPKSNPGRKANRPTKLHVYIGVGVGSLLLAMSAMLGIFFIARQLPESDPFEVAKYTGHGAAVRGLSLSADGFRAASYDETGAVRIWQPDHFKDLGTLPVKGAVRSLALSENGQFVATAGGEGLAVWDLDSRREKTHFDSGNVACAAIYPIQNSHLLAGANDGRIVLLDLGTSKPVRHYATQGAVRALCFLPDGARFLCGDSRGVLRLWNVHQQRELARCEAHTQGVRALAITPAGDRVLSCGDDGGLRLWKIDDLQLLQNFSPAADKLDPASVALSPGGTRALSSDADGKLRLWSCESGEILETFVGHAAPCACAVFFPNGRMAITGSSDGVIRLWRLPEPGELELKRAADAQEQRVQFGERIKSMESRRKLAEQARDRRQWTDALAELRTAISLGVTDTLEVAALEAAAREVAEVQRKENQYRAHCEAGKAAAEREDFAEAKRQFEAARQIFPEQPEAREGLELASRTDRVERVLKGARAGGGEIEFVDALPTPTLLTENATFAFLLTRLEPPMAEVNSPISWTMRFDFPEEFPDEKASLRVKLTQVADGAQLAEVDSPLIAGRKQQALTGRAPAPTKGWRAGRYSISTSLVTRKGVIPQGAPRDFSIGLLHWRKNTITLTPESVLQAKFSLGTGVQLARGDAFAISASGAMSPGPLVFYRDLLDNPKLAEAQPSKPTGIPWSNNDQRLRKYRTVSTPANYAALLMRITGQEWMPYVTDIRPVPSPFGGEIQLSINSIVPARAADAVDTASVRAYWQPNCGHYEVTIFRGEFVFPESLSPLHRAGLLARFTN